MGKTLATNVHGGHVCDAESSPTPAPTPALGEHFCGNGEIEPGEECDAPGSAPGDVPFQCSPYEFCNDECKCEFPQGACIDRTGVVMHGHECEGFIPEGPHTCCRGHDGQDLCHECGGCRTKVAITPSCCEKESACDDDDICCPIDIAGERVKICLDSSHGQLGDACSPQLCSPQDIGDGIDDCQNCVQCLDDTCGGDKLDDCPECRNTCFHGSKNSPAVGRRREIRALRGGLDVQHG